MDLKIKSCSTQGSNICIEPLSSPPLPFELDKGYLRRHRLKELDSILYFSHDILEARTAERRERGAEQNTVRGWLAEGGFAGWAGRTRGAFSSMVPANSSGSSLVPHNAPPHSLLASRRPPQARAHRISPISTRLESQEAAGRRRKQKRHFSLAGRGRGAGRDLEGEIVIEAVHEITPLRFDIRQRHAISLPNTAPVPHSRGFRGSQRLASTLVDS